MAERSPDALLAHVGGRVVWANQAAAVLLGAASAEALVGTEVLDLIAPDRRAFVQARLERLLEAGRPEPLAEEHLQRLDGTPVLAEVTGIPSGDGLILVVARDISARRAAEGRLAESERRYRDLVDQVPVGVWEEDLSEVKGLVDQLRARGVTDFHAHFQAHPEDAASCARLIRVVAVNAAACRMVGARDASELLANLDRILLPESLPQFAHELAELAQGASSASINGWNGTLDGSRRWVAMHAVLAEGHHQDWGRVVVTTADITERRQAREEREALQERLRHSEKLEAVGRLAGGVALDFNNILAGVLAHAELAQLDVAPGSPAASSLETIRAASHRARDLVRQILTFGKKDLPHPEPLDLTRVVTEALALVRVGIPAPVELLASLPPVGTVLADQTQLHQVVLNLCANAHHAVGGMGRIEVTLEDATPGPEVPELKGRRCARLRVRDDGVGMDEATRRHLFEPYLTTRAAQGGHGLGLAVVHGIVSAAGGAITVASSPGRGSTFDVWLPLVASPEVLRPRPTPAPGGQERILLVDDEPLVRSAHRRVLASLGYQVTVAVDAQQALGLLQAAPEAFDLILTDQAMPHLTGFDFARAWLREHPGARILLCTGFSDDVDAELATAAGLKGLLLKPISREALAAAIRAALA